MRIIRHFILLGASLVPLAAAADIEPLPLDELNAANLRVTAPADPNVRKIYIVQLQTPSAAEAFATASGPVMKALPGSGPRPRFDKTNALVQNYTAKIGAEQDSVLAKVGPGTEKVYSYRYGMNGFAALMTEPQANKLERMPEVLNVWEDEIRPLATNFSPDYLELFDRDIGLRGPRGLDGENIIIAFIDSGVYPEHPSLSDKKEADRPRACRSSWGESSLLGRWLCRRFRRAEDQLVFDPPEDWNGTCQVGESFEATDCNNKLIGARWFIDGAESSGAIDSGEFRSARDVDGHGTHTATIAAGVRKEASIYGTRVDEVQGMAPRARVAVYKACWLRPGDQRASCNTSDLAGAIDTAVADGVDIINYSVGTSMDR
ncbi:MAG: S8 family serine peptidase, partial [Woeseiaceae bacterium]|nr:S8 family serine peptidase [Woeseiaceae bacterium]